MVFVRGRRRVRFKKYTNIKILWLFWDGFDATKHFRDAFAAQLNLILALNLDLAKNQKTEDGKKYAEIEKPTSSQQQRQQQQKQLAAGVAAKKLNYKNN